MGKTRQKNVIIGIDGVPFRLVKDLIDMDIMPNFKQLLNDGILNPMKSTIPEVSAVSWSSIITGQNPGGHGVYGFTEIIDGTYTVSYHNFLKLKAHPFWHDGRFKYVIINVPATYPATKINGFIVTGFVSPDLVKAVYPRSFLNILREIKYKIDIDFDVASKSKYLLFKELYSTLDSRVKLYRYLWNNLEWDTLMFVITGSDRIGHFMWDAYLDEEHEWHQYFLEYFRVVDFVIGDISERLSENDNLIILSDHGMELKITNVNVNAYLEANNYLILNPSLGKSYNSITEETKAFALDPGRIYINKIGKYPRGSVKNSEVDNVASELISLFYDLKYDGKRVINKIYRKEDVYRGPYVDAAPDLILEPNPGFNLSARLSRSDIFEKDSLTGMHNRNAFLYVKNKENKSYLTNELSVEKFLSIFRKIRDDVNAS